MYQNQQLMSTTPELKMVTLCKKHKILLQKDKNSNTFYLAFESKNKHIDIPSIINFTMYELIGKLNEDVLEDIRIEKRHSDHDVEVLFLFKQFGQEVGIQKNTCIYVPSWNEQRTKLYLRVKVYHTMSANYKD